MNIIKVCLGVIIACSMFSGCDNKQCNEVCACKTDSQVCVCGYERGNCKCDSCSCNVKAE